LTTDLSEEQEPDPVRRVQRQPQDDAHVDVLQRSHEDLAEIVGAKEDRKARARRDAHRSVWFGFGMFGVIGWSVAVPAVACIALGAWIDNRWPSDYSWTLMLLFVGVILGCVNAWYWVTRERNKLGI
jgi:ATP synthase protein I